MRAPRTFHVYILTGVSRSRVLYIGVTSNLAARIDAHRRGEEGGFTARYGLSKLVYAEAFTYLRDAIARENQLERWRRERKIALIERANPTWDALSLVGPEGAHVR